MKNKWINPERVVSIMAFLFLSVAFLTSLNVKIAPCSIIPSQVIVRIVHAVSCTIMLFLIFKPIIGLKLGVLFLESFLTVLTTYEQLGIFLFYAAIIILFVTGFFQKHLIQKCIFLGSLHLISIFGCLPRGFFYFFLTLATSLFYLSFFIWIYDILKNQLSCFLPHEISSNNIIKDILPGSELKLSDFNLSERQANFVCDNLHSNCSYKELSEKYFVSLSTVKKDFSEVYKIFGVSKLEELHILLLQYHVTK